MALLDQLRKDNIQAMKDKDATKKAVFSLLISAMALQEKESKRKLTSEEELKIVQKELKQERETLSLTPQDRTDLIEVSQKKIALIESYLPKQLSEEEIKTLLLKFIEDNNLELIKKNQGVIMKGILQVVKGQADGKTISKVLGTLLH